MTCQRYRKNQCIWFIATRSFATTMVRTKHSRWAREERAPALHRNGNRRTATNPKKTILLHIAGIIFVPLWLFHISSLEWMKVMCTSRTLKKNLLKVSRPDSNTEDARYPKGKGAEKCKLYFYLFDKSQYFNLNLMEILDSKLQWMTHQPDNEWDHFSEVQGFPNTCKRSLPRTCFIIVFPKFPLALREFRLCRAPSGFHFAQRADCVLLASCWDIF